MDEFPQPLKENVSPWFTWRLPTNNHLYSKKEKGTVGVRLLQKKDRLKFRPQARV